MLNSCARAVPTPVCGLGSVGRLGSLRTATLCRLLVAVRGTLSRCGPPQHARLPLQSL